MSIVKNITGNTAIQIISTRALFLYSISNENTIKVCRNINIPMQNCHSLPKQDI
jgi:hypothetical protein